MNNLRRTLLFGVPGQYHDATHAHVSSRFTTHREDYYLRLKETEDFSKPWRVNPNPWLIVIYQYRTFITGNLDDGAADFQGEATRRSGQLSEKSPR